MGRNLSLVRYELAYRALCKVALVRLDFLVYYSEEQDCYFKEHVARLESTERSAAERVTAYARLCGV
jgi:hypothetical protein